LKKHRKQTAERHFVKNLPFRFFDKKHVNNL
jgi:hypothetical protein